MNFNRVFFGVWGVLAIVTLVFNIIIFVKDPDSIHFWIAFIQLLVVLFIARRYWVLEKEAQRKRRQKARVKRFAERFARSEHPFRMPKVGE